MCAQRDAHQYMDLLQQWLDNSVDGDAMVYEKDVYFDCLEQWLDDDDLLNRSVSDQMVHYPYTAVHYPWISEIWLCAHRKTSLFRRFRNWLGRSRDRSLPNLAEEFVRIYAGQFSHPLGFRFHLSYAREKWLLVLKNLKYVNYPTFPYPQTRIILIRKGVSYIAR